MVSPELRKGRAMARVKGTLLVGFVKTIRADKSGVYNSYFNDLDQEMFSQRILASGWYAFETYKKCFKAVVQVAAKGDMAVVRQWGQIYAESILKEVYKNIIVEDNPQELLIKMMQIKNLLFDFGEFNRIAISEKKVRLQIKGFDPKFEAFYQLLRGWFEKSLELGGAKNVQSEFTAKSWEGDPDTSIELSYD
jgi:hypothetical protein